MADATRFRRENAEIAIRAGWRVTSLADSDQFTRGDVTIDVALSPKDYIRHIVKHGPNNEYVVVERNTVGKVDLLRFWLTGRPSNVISPSVKRAAGVDW
jgi:hypothetical protein